MTKRQKRRSQPGRAAGSSNAVANRVAHEDRILEGLLVKSLALHPGAVVQLEDGRVAMTREALAVYTDIGNACRAFSIGQHRMQAALVRLGRKGML